MKAVARRPIAIDFSLGPGVMLGAQNAQIAKRARRRRSWGKEGSRRRKTPTTSTTTQRPKRYGVGRVGRFAHTTRHRRIATTTATSSRGRVEQREKGRGEGGSSRGQTRRGPGPSGQRRQLSALSVPSLLSLTHLQMSPFLVQHLTNDVNSLPAPFLALLLLKTIVITIVPFAL